MKFRMRLWLASLGIALLILYVTLSSYYAQRILHGPHASLAQARQSMGAPADYGLPVPQEISILAGGVRLAGWYFDLPGSACGAAVFHGRGGTRYDCLPMARVFAAYGCDIVLIDFRNHGASAGSADTYGGYERQDVWAALDYLQQRSGLPDGKLSLAGSSYGAGIVVQAAARRPGLAFILLDSVYRSMADVVFYQGGQQGGPAMQVLAPGALAISGLEAKFNPWDASPIKYAPLVKAPVLIIHERRDASVPAAQAQAVFDRISHPNKALHIVDWSGYHGGALASRPEAYQALMDVFIQQYAPGFGVR
jgi:pimeloyl-ACP methyl ester carboxylesterase